METLSACVARGGALSELDAAGWIVRLAKRVEALHHGGGAHGAISHESVLVGGSRRTAAGRLLDARVAPNVPAFVSPERGDGAPGSVADDTWAIGVLLYVLLTGALPFSGADAQKVRARIASGRPLPLAVHGVDDPDLQAMIDELLARSSDKRTLRVAQLRARLEAWRPEARLEQLPPVDDEPRSAPAVKDEPAPAAREEARALPPPVPPPPKPRSLPPPKPTPPPRRPAPPSASPSAAPAPAPELENLEASLDLVDSVLAPASEPPAPARIGAGAQPILPLAGPLPDSVPPSRRGDGAPAAIVGTSAMVATNDSAVAPSPPLGAASASSAAAPAARARRPSSSRAVVAAVAVICAIGAGGYFGWQTSAGTAAPPAAPSAPASKQGPGAPSSPPPPAQTAGAPSSGPAQEVGSGTLAPRDVGSGTLAPRDVSACVRSLMAEGTFEAGSSFDFGFVCTERDPRRGSGAVKQRVVLAGGGTRVSDGMREWAMLGWYEVPTYVVLRAACCPSPAPLDLPSLEGTNCESFAKVLEDLAAAVAPAPSAERAEDALGRYTRNIYCAFRSGSANLFGPPRPPAGGEDTTFRKTLARALARTAR